MLEHDYVMRMVQQLVEFITRISGLKKSGKLDEAVEALREAKGELLDMDTATLASLDAASAVQVLAEDAKLTVFLHLLVEEADLQRKLGHNDDADRLERRSLAVADAIAATDGEKIDALLEVVDHVHERFGGRE